MSETVSCSLTLSTRRRRVAAERCSRSRTCTNKRLRKAAERGCHFRGLPQSFPVKYLQNLKLQLLKEREREKKKGPAAGSRPNLKERKREFMQRIELQVDVVSQDAHESPGNAVERI